MDRRDALKGMAAGSLAVATLDGEALAKEPTIMSNGHSLILPQPFVHGDNCVYIEWHDWDGEDIPFTYDFETNKIMFYFSKRCNYSLLVTKDGLCECVRAFRFSTSKGITRFLDISKPQSFIKLRLISVKFVNFSEARQLSQKILQEEKSHA